MTTTSCCLCERTVPAARQTLPASTCTAAWLVLWRKLAYSLQKRGRHLSNPFPTAENFLSQLRDLHIGTSNHDGRPILPDRLLRLICHPIIIQYQLEFLTNLTSTPRYAQKIANPHRTLQTFLTSNTQAINVFRDALPEFAFDPEQEVTETKSLDLEIAYRSFADVIRSNLPQLRSAGLIDEDSLFPLYYHDFSEPMPSFDEPEPRFARDEPAHPGDRRWNIRRLVREYRLRAWKERKRKFEDTAIPRWEKERQRYEKTKKRFESVRNHEQLIFVGTPYCRHWAHFLDPVTLKFCSSGVRLAPPAS